MLKKLESQIRFLYDQYVSHTDELTMDQIIQSVELWDWDVLLPLGREIHRLVTSYVYFNQRYKVLIGS